MDINEIKRIGKVAEDFSRIWQVKSSKMMEILPKIFKKNFFIFIFFKIPKNFEEFWRISKYRRPTIF